jgi:hypothetical protein
MEDVSRFKRSYDLFKVILYLIENEGMVFSYKSSLSNVCKIQVWQQKYEPCLKKLGIISKPKNAKKGTYIFNLNNFHYLLFNSILEDEKKEVLALLNWHKKNILKEYNKYFKKYDLIMKYVENPKFDSDKEAKKIDWITGQVLKSQDKIDEKLEAIFGLFAREDIIRGIDFMPPSLEKYHLYKEMIQQKADVYNKEKIRKNFDKLRSKIFLAFDELIYSVETLYSVNELKLDAQKYFIDSFNRALKREIMDYKEIKEQMTKIWSIDAKSKIPALMALPHLKEGLRGLK